MTRSGVTIIVIAISYVLSECVTQRKVVMYSVFMARNTHGVAMVISASCATNCPAKWCSVTVSALLRTNSLRRGPRHSPHTPLPHFSCRNRQYAENLNLSPVTSFLLARDSNNNTVFLIFNCYLLTLIYLIS